MLILASASPRRRALLTSAGVSFEVIPAHLDESPLFDEAPMVYVERIASQKASAIAQKYPFRPVLAADSVVLAPGGNHGESIFGKPTDRQDAARMLALLSGKTHRVVTYVALAHAGKTQGFSVSSRVCFRELSEADIAFYIGTGEPMDKAGAYGIQGEGVGIVRWVEGSYTNVVGLPLVETLDLLRGVLS